MRAPDDSFVLSSMSSSDEAPSAVPVHPPNSRVRISGLSDRADLNGVEARIIAWHDAKQRFSVAVHGHSSVLIRAQNLARSAYPTARLDFDALEAIFSDLPCWSDAARAMAVQRSWHNALKTGAWPRHAAADTPRHWKQLEKPLETTHAVPDSLLGAGARGSASSERLPFARPPKWALSDARPSWLNVLHGRPGVERATQVLEWLDRMDELWPGVVVPRWPGAARRLAWMIGADDKALKMWHLRGCIHQKLPGLFGAPSVDHFKGYRRLETRQFDDSEEPARRCYFELPADAALFVALMPMGFGEIAVEDSLNAPYGGLEFALAPWEEGQFPFSHVDIGCDPEKLVTVAYTPKRDFYEDTRDHFMELFLKQILLCCDTASDKCGKLLLVEFLPSRGKEQDGRRVPPTYTWTEAYLPDLLMLVLNTAEETLKLPSAGQLNTAAPATRRMHLGGVGRPEWTKWDLAWQVKFYTLQRLIASLKKHGAGPHACDAAEHDFQRQRCVLDNVLAGRTGRRVWETPWARGLRVSRNWALLVAALSCLWKLLSSFW